MTGARRRLGLKECHQLGSSMSSSLVGWLCKQLWVVVASCITTKLTPCFEFWNSNVNYRLGLLKGPPASLRQAWEMGMVLWMLKGVSIVLWFRETILYLVVSEIIQVEKDSRNCDCCLLLCFSKDWERRLAKEGSLAPHTLKKLTKIQGVWQ